MIEFKKNPNESRLHFIWRLYKYQEDTDMLDNDKCGDICRRELNETYNESAYRKTFQSFNRMWNEVKYEYVDEDQVLQRIAEIEEKEDELFKKKVQTSDWVREKRKVLRDEARIDQLKDLFASAIRSVPDFQLSKYKEKHYGDKTGILSLSDWHIGVVIDNYFNTYNQDIAIERVDKLLQHTISYCKIHNIGMLYVLQLGDLVSGSIHSTVRLAENCDTIQQTMFAATLIYKLLSDLSTFGLDIKYVSVAGNHDRKVRNKNESIETENFTKLVDWHIQTKIEDGKLDIDFLTNEIDDNIGMFEIDNKKFLCVHGHNDNIGKICSDLGMALEFRPYAVFAGHWHKHANFPQGFSRVLINGSLCGVDEYAKNKRLFGYPSQRLFILGEGRDDIDISIGL